MKVCNRPGCPELTDQRYCTAHQPRSRASRDSASYAHRKLRQAVAHLVAAGQATCSRCGHPISPHEPWHLDHTDDRTGYRGPSHAQCNASAAGRAAHRAGTSPPG